MSAAVVLVHGSLLFYQCARELSARATKWAFAPHKDTPGGYIPEWLTNPARSCAVELGLDMTAYDAAVADPATAQRVRVDFNEGRALGVRSTPTSFADGQPVVIERWNDVEAAIQEALSR